MSKIYFNWVKYLLAFHSVATCALAFNSPEEIFTHIYHHNIWGEGSGDGSKVENAKIYVAFLQDFFKKHNIHSVVDFGCGDWQFSKFIDWHGIDYIGYDVVKFIIERNSQKFGSSSISFIHINGIDFDLKEADLLICKDVLQHLSYEEITNFIKHLGKFKHCLITNDVDPASLTCTNFDIKTGEYRLLDLTQSPFNLKGDKILNFFVADGSWVKQVLWIH